MTIVRVADEALVEQAPLVVVGQVTARGPAASGAAVTEYRFAVEETLKGFADAELTVRVPGGMGANGIGRHIFGAPSFSPGERAILFLEPQADGGHRILHLAQGAFHEVRQEGRSLALRDLDEVTEVRLRAGGLEAAPADAAEPVRDFAAFARWIGDVARGLAPAADYRVAAAPAVGPGRVSAPFSLFKDGKDGLGMRWFEFDTGGSVPWKFGVGGQPGVPGGGEAEFKVALNAWNADSQTPIRYLFDGTSAASGGLCDVPTCGFEGYDQLNVLLFGDPNDELTDLINGSGTLAHGGPWYTPGTLNFRGQQYHVIINADIVINNGLEGFFAASPNARKAAEELFAHELGHTLGIDHTNVAGALMQPTIHDEGGGAQLHQDDLAAARALYRQASNPPPGKPPAAPTGLAAEAVSATEIALTWEDKSSNETGFVVEAALLGGNFTALDPPLPAGTTQATVFGLAPATGYLFRVKAINAQGSSAYTAEVQASTDALPGFCLPGAQTLCLADGRFRVEVDWETAQATSGEGQVVPGVSSADSGLFWFFQESNWEMLVKVLAACPVNNHFWVFLAATTDVEYFVTVTDTETNKVRTYFNPQGETAETVTDTGAFATCP